MDAKAYLMGQGWSGPGNPLNPSRRPGGPHGGLGLTKPILVSKKRNTYGIGKKAGRDHTNQWWLKGFEEALKSVGTDGSATPSEQGVKEVVRQQSELYRYFVRGQGLPGTISGNNDREGTNGVGESVETDGKEKKKRKRDEKATSTEVLSKKRKAKKIKATDGEKFTNDDATLSTKDIDAKLKKKKDKERKRQGRSQDPTATSSNDDKEDSSSKDESKKIKRRKEKGDEGDPTAVVSTESTDKQSSGTSVASISKEERKRQKALRKAAKEARKADKKEKDSKRKKKKSKSDDVA